MEHRVARATVQREAMLAAQRTHGNHGTVIDPHRAIATVRLTAVDVGLAVILALGTTAALVQSLGAIGRAWAWAYGRLAAPLGFIGGVGLREVDAPPIAAFSVPYFNVEAPQPDQHTWWITLVAAVALFAISFVLKDEFLPLAYALRLATLLQGTALFFFYFAPQTFPYDLPHYVSSMLSAGIAVVLIVPTVLALTFYVVDVGIARKVALTAAMVGHLLVFIPLQYAVQTYVIVHGSLLLLPVSFMFFGLLPEVMILIALYGWGMSWPAQRPRGRRQ